MYTQIFIYHPNVYILPSIPVLQLGEIGRWGTAFTFGILTSVGLLIKGAFAYYIYFWAQKDRPLNTMLLLDNVNTIFFF